MNIREELAKIAKHVSEFVDVEVEEAMRVKVGTVNKEILERIEEHRKEVSKVKSEISERINDFKRKQKKEEMEFRKGLLEEYKEAQDKVTAEKTTLFMLAANGDEKLQHALFSDDSYIDHKTGDVLIEKTKKEKVIGRVSQETIDKLKANTKAYKDLEDELKARLDIATDGLKEEFAAKGKLIDQQQEQIWVEILAEIGHEGDVNKDEYSVDRQSGEVAQMVYE